MNAQDAAKLVGQSVKALTKRYGFVNGTIKRITNPDWMGRIVCTISGTKTNDRRYTVYGVLVFDDEPERKDVPATFEDWCWLNRRTRDG